MVTVRELVTKLTFRVDNRAIAQFDRSIAQLSQRLNKVSEQAMRVGRGLSTRLTLPILGVGIGIAKVGADFELAMNKVQALTGAAGDEFAKLEAQAREMGATTQFRASEAAEAMGFLGLAGFKTNEILGTIPGTLTLAASAQMDLATSADIMAKVMRGYGLDVSQASRVTDVLTKAFTTSNTDLRQLSEAFKMAGPVAHAAGLDFEETAAALGLMGNAGFQASLGGTSLRGVMSRLAKMAPATRKELAKVGIRESDLIKSNGQLRSLADILDVLRNSGADLGTIMAVFGDRAGPGLQALLEQGSGALREMTATLRAAGGTAERIAAVQMRGLTGAWRTFRSALEDVAITLSKSGIADFFGMLLDKGTKVLRWFAALNDRTKTWVVIAAAAAASIGPIVLGLGLLTKAASIAIGALRGVGVATAFANAQLLLMPAAILATLAAVWLVADDIAGFFEGKRSLTGALVANFDKLIDTLATKLREILLSIGEAVQGAFSLESNPLVSFAEDARYNLQALLDLMTAVGDKWQRTIDIFSGRDSGFGLWDWLRGPVEAPAPSSFLVPEAQAAAVRSTVSRAAQRGDLSPDAQSLVARLQSMRAAQTNVTVNVTTPPGAAPQEVGDTVAQRVLQVLSDVAGRAADIEAPNYER